MPSSESSNISLIVQIVSKLKPSSILDVGIGNGKYGFLFRDYLDGHWVTGHAFHDKSTWTLKLIGIEVFPKYITPVQNYIYNDIWLGNAKDILKERSGQAFDLVFLGDVIEHFTKEEGVELIKCIRDKWLTPHGCILISTPNFQTRIDDPKRSIFGNSNEMHLSRWYAPEFKGLGMKCEITDGKLLTVLLRKGE